MTSRAWRLLGLVPLGVLLGAMPTRAQPLQDLESGVLQGEVTIEGTVTSWLDGVERDFASGTSVGPFVPLPSDAEIVEAEPSAHRYVVRFPTPARLRIDVGALAQRHLVTRSEARRTLEGRIVVLPSGVAVSSATESTESQLVPWARWIGWVTGGIVLLGLISLRRRDEDRLVARVRRGARRIDEETRRLAWHDEVAGALVDEAKKERTRLRAVRRALRRVHRLAGAQEERAGLEQRASAARRRLEDLACATERIAATLATHGIDSASPQRQDLTEMLESLVLAVESEREVDALLTS